MAEKVVYEIARYDGSEDVAELIDRIKLVSIDGTLKLRGASGDETLCAGDDVVFDGLSQNHAMNFTPSTTTCR